MKINNKISGLFLGLLFLGSCNETNQSSLSGENLQLSEAQTNGTLNWHSYITQGGIYEDRLNCAKYLATVNSHLEEEIKSNKKNRIKTLYIELNNLFQGIGSDSEILPVIPEILLKNLNRTKEIVEELIGSLGMEIYKTCEKVNDAPRYSYIKAVASLNNRHNEFLGIIASANNKLPKGNKINSVYELYQLVLSKGIDVAFSKKFIGNNSLEIEKIKYTFGLLSIIHQTNPDIITILNKSDLFDREIESGLLIGKDRKVLGTMTTEPYLLNLLEVYFFVDEFLKAINSSSSLDQSE